MRHERLATTHTDIEGGQRVLRWRVPVTIWRVDRAFLSVKRMSSERPRRREHGSRPSEGVDDELSWPGGSRVALCASSSRKPARYPSTPASVGMPQTLLASCGQSPSWSNRSPATATCHLATSPRVTIRRAPRESSWVRGSGVNHIDSASKLLATQGDPDAAIKNGVTTLYDLRSSLVHGTSTSEEGLRRTLETVSTVPTGEMFGVILDFAVDRLRDIVRRAFLARLCISRPPAPLWLLEGCIDVSTALADAATALM